MHTSRAILSKIRVLFLYFQNRQGKPPTFPLSSFSPKFIFLKKADTPLTFLRDNVQFEQKLSFEFKKPTFTWLVAAILVY